MSETGERRLTFVEAIIYWEREERLDNLVRNLVAVAALCESFNRGWTQRGHVVASVAYSLDDHWRPGCGRVAP